MTDTLSSGPQPKEEFSVETADGSAGVEGERAGTE